MPTYRYIAIDSQNRRISGTYEAGSEREVQVYLRRNGLKAEKITRSWLHSDIRFGDGVKTKDLIVFTRMFATMAKAAVPISQALNTLYEQTESRTLKRAIQRIIVDVEQGAALSEAMRNQETIFEPLYYSMVAAGEQSGNLNLMLERLGDLYERTDRIRSKIKEAMVYPAVLLIVALGVIMTMLLFVVPQFVSLFSSFDTELPVLTQAALAASNYLTDYWWVPILTIAVVVAAFLYLRKQPHVAAILDRIVIRLKIIGPIVQKSAIARFSRTLATLVSSGLGILEALDLTAKTAGNIVIAQAIEEARTAVSTGSDLTDPIRNSGVFPPLVTSMIAIGEQTGELDTMLDKLADFYEAEVNNAIEGAIKLIEPAMLVTMGAIVGLIMASLYLPMFDLISAIDE